MSIFCITLTNEDAALSGFLQALANHKPTTVWDDFLVYQASVFKEALDAAHVATDCLLGKKWVYYFLHKRGFVQDDIDNVFRSIKEFKNISNNSDEVLVAVCQGPLGSELQLPNDNNIVVLKGIWHCDK